MKIILRIGKKQYSGSKRDRVQLFIWWITQFEGYNAMGINSINSSVTTSFSMTGLYRGFPAVQSYTASVTRLPEEAQRRGRQRPESRRTRRARAAPAITSSNTSHPISRALNHNFCSSSNGNNRNVKPIMNNSNSKRLHKVKGSASFARR